MFRLILKTCLKGKVKFYKNKWGDFLIEAGHSSGDVRYFPIFWWLPYFWDSEIAFDLGIKIPENIKAFSETWSYQWELRNLDGDVVKKGDKLVGGYGTINVTNKGFFRKFIRAWTCGKARAFVLSELHPHREYILYASFAGYTGQSDMLRIASFNVDDRTSYHFQLFLILFSIIASLFFAGLFKGCWIGV